MYVCGSRWCKVSFPWKKSFRLDTVSQREPNSLRRGSLLACPAYNQCYKRWPTYSPTAPYRGSSLRKGQHQRHKCPVVEPPRSIRSCWNIGCHQKLQRSLRQRGGPGRRVLQLIRLHHDQGTKDSTTAHIHDVDCRNPLLTLYLATGPLGECSITA